MKLVDINAIQPSTYNPRQADPRRLDLIELSLRKLGFIHPVFSDANGEILSGHQRQFVAKRMGFTHIPVEYTDEMDLNKRKAINIAFNRGTNDFSFADTCATLKAALEQHDPYGLAESLPDCPQDQLFRCLQFQMIPTADLVRKNAGKWNQYACNIARTLRENKIFMPIICTPDLTVVNGIGRLQLNAEKNITLSRVVFIREEEAAFANVMLNYLSMDFDIHTRYADLLRYNSFRRPSGVKSHLGRSFTFAIVKSKASKTFSLDDPYNKALWTKTYGHTVCDFGCGLMDETNILRKAGITSIPFEPYFLDENREIAPAISRKIACDFLQKISTGIKFDSIFLSAVLNSVPFLEDRKHVVCILNALSLPGTKIFAHAASDKNSAYDAVAGREKVSRSSASLCKFVLDYEPRTTIGEIGARPKVQKYHTPAEWYSLWSEFFRKVTVTESQGNVQYICCNPREISKERLFKALEHEFDLPYPDGSRMGLAQASKEAFMQRSSITGRKFL